LEKIFVDTESAADALSLSVSTLEKLVREGNFPRPRELSGRRVGFLVRELKAWAESRPESGMLPPPNTGAKKNRASAG
jgi:prophage regulatory protein